MEHDVPKPPPLPGTLARRLRPVRMGLRASALALLILFPVLVGSLGVWLFHMGAYSLDERSLSVFHTIPALDNTVVYDRDGNTLGEFFRQYRVHVPFEDIPHALVQAILAVEDRNFWNHPGYDWKAILRAGWVHLTGRAYSQGGSTLTQQLVRNYLLTKDKTYTRKIQEILLARRLESLLSKKKIFELYANTLFLGNGAYGVGAAAQRHFGKALDRLSLAELAVIAGLFQSPAGYNPVRHPERALERSHVVLDAMVEAGFLTARQAQQAKDETVTFAPERPLNDRQAPYFLDHVFFTARTLLEESGNLYGEGLRIHTTLSLPLQRAAERAIAESAESLDRAARDAAEESGGPAPAVEAAIVALDPATGEILAMVGGRDHGSTQFNRVTQSRRSPASVFKPVVFSLALEEGWHWNDMTYVGPLTVNNYRPRNATSDYLTETTLLRAFYRSINTPVVELAEQLGLGRVLSHARALGVETPLREEIGTSIGGSEVTMMDVARLFATFANRGVRVAPVAISRIEDRRGKVLYESPKPELRSQRVLSEPTAYLMTEGLRSVLRLGTGHESRQLAEIAVGKTGTSDGARDNWFAGYTSHLVAVVWVGTDHNASLGPEANGSRLALPLWDRFLTATFPHRPPAPFTAPAGVSSHNIHPLYGTAVDKGGITAYFRGKHAPRRELSALQVLKEQGHYRDIFD